MRFTISILLLFILNSVFAQQKNALSQEEYIQLQAKIRLSANSNIDSSFIYAQQLAKSNNNKHLAFATAAMSYLYQLKGKPEKSKENYILAFKYLDKMADSNDKIQLKSYLYNYGGLSEWKRGNFGKALEIFHTGMKLSVALQDIIQIAKFKGNIALINDKVGNYQLAIKNLRQLNDFVDQNENVYNKEQFLNIKSNTNLTLGSSYESYFMKNKNKRFLLDSAEYFYKKTVYYSELFTDNKMVAKLSLGNIYSIKSDYANAEKIYYDIIIFAQQNKLQDDLCVANYNLGDIYFVQKKYRKALVFFKKTDSIAALSKANEIDFLKSNYYQAKIYNILKEPELAYKHSKIYLNNYEKFETKLDHDVLEVNLKLGLNDLDAEMLLIEEKYKYDVLWNKILKAFYGVLVVGIIFLLIKNRKDKIKARKKMNALIEEFKINLEKKNNPEPELAVPEAIEDSPIKKDVVNLTLDEAKENRIVEKLLALENKLEYLNADFTLPYVAKKIKTNTTYLSYVVNKRFGKSFGEYSNELKINYVINEMITNHMYRKYSTQAIAESVGFKNAVSFAKSFRKRTGVSPAQFANNI
nr:helix-turn-helix domain-containing protein [uncultured Flavobacterium sp.]